MERRCARDCNCLPPSAGSRARVEESPPVRCRQPYSLAPSVSAYSSVDRYCGPRLTCLSTYVSIEAGPPKLDQPLQNYSIRFLRSMAGANDCLQKTCAF
eukprot:2700431-Pyramimonas_sp.AAC.1